MTRSRARQVEETYSGASKRSLNYVDSEVTVFQRFESLVQEAAHPSITEEGGPLPEAMQCPLIRAF
jgi:hypothetical protein